jgi:hypothetical protein
MSTNTLTYCEKCLVNMEDDRFDYRFDYPVCFPCVEENGLRLCEICESNEPRTLESKWCDSCRDDFKESDR